MFRVNNKDTRTTSTPFSSVSIVEVEQVNVSWVAAQILNYSYACILKCKKSTSYLNISKYYFKVLWACLGETTPILKNYIDLWLLWMYNPMQKTNLIYQAFLDLLKFHESLNRIG